MSIHVSRTKDISASPHVNFNDLSAVAADMAITIQLQQIIEVQGGVMIRTPLAKAVFMRMSANYLEYLEQKAKDYEFARNSTQMDMRNKIDDQASEIAELKRKLRFREERRKNSVAVVEAEPENLQRVPNTQRGSLKDA